MDDECPDSTVLMDDDDVDESAPEHFSHNNLYGNRRSFDEPREPQSSRVTSTGVHFNSGNNYTFMPTLPPLPKLIFRPPTQANLYPSVSFSSAGSSSRLGSSSNTSSNSASRSEQVGSRLAAFPASRSESFPGTRVNTNSQSREDALPRIDPISRSELTISRVGSTPARGENSSRMGTSGSASRNEIPVARVGGVSISRVDSSSFPRLGSSSASISSRLEMPKFSRGSLTSPIPQQLDITPSRKFGRRFLKSTPSGSKPQNVSRMPMVSMRASSTEEYFSPAGRSHLSNEDPLAMDGEAALDYGSRRPGYSAPSSTTSYANATSTTILGSGTLTSQQSSQGIKLHISKKPVEVIEVDDSSSERSTNSLSSSLQHNSDSNVGIAYDFSSPPSVSVSANNSSSSASVEEMSVKPVTLKVPLKERLKIPEGLLIDEVDDEGSKDVMMIASDAELEDECLTRKTPFIQNILLGDESKKLVELDGSARRTRRKRPTEITNEVPQKMRRRRGETPALNQDAALTPTSTDNTVTPPRGRGRGTGRGRGRPRGSTNKAKLERQQQLLQSVEIKDEPVPEVSPEKTVTDTKEGLPLEGDAEVNAELSSVTTPTRKPRGRGRGSATPRGTGTPRSARASRGTRGTRSPRGEKKSPEAKKLKSEKKEAIKAPPPVQVFEEETRMSADIKPPIPERVSALVTPVVIDEESRASNVSSTSTSTTAKAKRFTKDPIEERKPVTAETLYEYQWPLNDKNADFYFLQEQISEYLGVKSFKRKYPDIRRRVVDMEERDFLRESKVVSEVQCDLGLTAVHSCDVLDIMFNDFTDKYEEYRKVFQERKEQEISKLKPESGVEAPAVRDRSAEFMRRILKSCAKWNLNINQERMSERICSFDLQTGTLHYPGTMQKVLPTECTKIGKYPVAVLPGQFTDDFKKYTSQELFYLPLNSVRYGPVSENWIVNSDSSDESTDSDDSTSSDDSSTSSSDEDIGSDGDNDQHKVVLTDDCGNLLYRGPIGLTKVSTEATCKSCDGDAFSNKDGNSEVLLHCSRCDVANHPTCLELALDMLPFITKYHWECTDCKNCIECNDPADEDKMLFCDCCDRGYHIYCVGLRKVPNGRWHCSVCSACYSCGVTQPSPEDRMAEWHHEFRKGEKGAKFYLHSFCVACYKLFKKGQFCPSCLKVHSKLDVKGLLECRKCEKWVHKECVKRPLKSMFGFMCDPCDAAFRSRSKLPSHVN